MKSKANYVILSEKSEFLRSLVSKHIVSLNIKEGVYPHPSMFGQYIVVSNKNDPSKVRYIISYVNRVSDDFKWNLLDLDADPLPTIYEILGIDSRDCKLFIRNKVWGRGSIPTNTLYYYCVLLRGCITEDSFNHTKANLIIDNYDYVSTSSTLEKYKSLNAYVNTPTEETLFHMVKVFSNNSDKRRCMVEVAYCIKNILEGSVPSYIESRVQFSNEVSTQVQYLVLATEVATFEDFSGFISNLIGKLA